MGDLRSLFAQWKLEHLVEDFEDYGIDVDDLDLLEDMDEDSMVKLISDPDDLATFRKRCAERKATLGGLEVKTEVKEEEEFDKRNHNEDAALSSDDEESVTIIETSKTHPKVLDIWQVLIGTLHGKSLILNYQTLGTFTAHTRTKLTTIVCEKLCDENIECNKEVYREIAAQIVEIFPNESMETYFIPSAKNKKGKHIQTGGKLVSQHKRLKSYYSKLGLLTNNKKHNLRVTINWNRFRKPRQTVTEAEPEKKWLKWLKISIEPWQEVLERWAETYSERYEERKSSILVNDFDDYAPLREPEGHSLIEIDFRLMLPGSEDKLFSKWELLVQKIQIKAERVANSRNMRMKNLLNLLSSSIISDESRVVCIFLLLANLCYTKTSKFLRINGTAGYWKPSVQDTEQAFILHVKSRNEIDKAIEDREEEYISRGMYLLPFTLVVASNESEHPTECYVVINREVRYKMNSVLQAVDLCFKSYCVFHAKFPFECTVLYMFLKKYVYEIHSDLEKVPLNVETFINDFM